MVLVFVLSLMGFGAIILVVAYATKVTLDTWFDD